MCAIISVADLQHETYELFEEESFDRLATRRGASQVEYGWEQDATDFPELDLEAARRYEERLSRSAG